MDAVRETLHLDITYMLGKIESTDNGLGDDTKQRLIIAQSRGAPLAMLDRSYNLHCNRIHGTNLKDYPEY